MSKKKPNPAAVDAAKSEPVSEPVKPKIEKTLANCKPSEFMRQTYRVKKLAEKWLTDTDIMNIRKNVPTPAPIDPDASPEEKAAQIKANAEAAEKAGLENFSKMFDAVFGEYPDETLTLLAACCFIEPERIDDYDSSDYFSALTDILQSQTVITFFTSFTALARTITGDSAKA